MEYPGTQIFSATAAPVLLPDLRKQARSFEVRRTLRRLLVQRSVFYRSNVDTPQDALARVAEPVPADRLPHLMGVMLFPRPGCVRLSHSRSCHGWRNHRRDPDVIVGARVVIEQQQFSEISSVRVSARFAGRLRSRLVAHLCVQLCARIGDYFAEEPARPCFSGCTRA